MLILAVEVHTQAYLPLLLHVWLAKISAKVATKLIMQILDLIFLTSVVQVTLEVSTKLHTSAFIHQVLKT